MYLHVLSDLFSFEECLQPHNLNGMTGAIDGPSIMEACVNDWTIWKNFGKTEHSYEGMSTS